MEVNELGREHRTIGLVEVWIGILLDDLAHYHPIESESGLDMANLNE